MGVGEVLIIIAFGASLVATFGYFLQARSAAAASGVQLAEAKKPIIANRSFLVVVGVSVVASILMWYYFLSHQFQFTYVYRYSSSDLPFVYLISAFWAGQEGTFLFWALLVALIGFAFRKSSDRDGGYAMSIVSLFLSFLYLLMFIKSPFETSVAIPPDGAGLNPLLQDPWMAIHPPILFVGYAAIVVPFALAISALIRRDFTGWVSDGFRWTLISALMLGAGIIIGGFWAYEVLGWGGYWGWDPVENSSLVPWLTILALVHGLAVQQTKGSLVKTNLALALVSFVLVLYATFLTRSGVLADFSVHSFVDLGINNYLIGALVVSTFIGFGLLAARAREIKAPRIEIKTINRELILFLSIVALCVVALFTIVGTSSPILTGLFGNPSQVDTSFYNKINLPVAIVIALLLAVAPFLAWTERDRTSFLKRMYIPMGLTVISGVVAFLLDVRSIGLFLFVLFSAFAMWSNLYVITQQARITWLNTGGPLAHLGVALMFIGIVASESFDTTEHMVIKKGGSQTAFGRVFTFLGPKEGGGPKTRMEVEVADGDNKFIAQPKLYFSEYNNAAMREPDIKILPLRDLYITAVELKSGAPPHEHPVLEFKKEEAQTFDEYKITFLRFISEGHMEGGQMSVGAVLNVETHGRGHEVIPGITFDEKGERHYHPVALPKRHNPAVGAEVPEVVLLGINVDEKKVALQFNGFDDHSAHDQDLEVVLEVTSKPLMLVVWAGVVLILVGTVVGYRRRTLQG